MYLIILCRYSTTIYTSVMNVDSCNYICTYVPPEMKATIDELTKRATEKEAGMVHQVVHCHMYIQYLYVCTRLTHTYVLCLYILCVVLSAYISYSHVHVHPVL